MEQMAKHVAAERIGRRLEQERDRLGLSQEDAAKLVKVSHRTWQRWEKEGVMPYGRNMIKIASALGINEDELLALRGAVVEEGLQEQLDRIETKLDRALAELLPQALGEDDPGRQRANSETAEKPGANENPEEDDPPQTGEQP